MGNPAEFSTKLVADPDITVDVTNATFELKVGTATVTSAELNCTTDKTMTDIATAFNGKDITINGVVYTIANQADKLKFTAKASIVVAIMDINDLPMIVSQNDGGTAVTWTSEQNLAANAKTIGAVAGVGAWEGVTLNANTAPIIPVGSAQISKKFATTELKTVTKIMSLFNGIELEYGNVWWVMTQATPSDNFVTVKPKAVPVDYDALSAEDKAKNNSTNDIKLLQTPPAQTSPFSNVANLTAITSEINVPVGDATNYVKYRFKDNGSSIVDNSTIEFYVDTADCFTAQARLTSQLSGDNIVWLESDELQLTNPSSRLVRAKTSFVAVDAIEAVGISVPSEVTVQVGEKAEIKPKFYQAGANAVGNVRYFMQNESAVVEQDGNNAIIYGVNATAGITEVTVEMQNGSYAVDTQRIQVVVRPQDFKEQASLVKPTLSKTKLELTVGKTASINVLGLLDWQKVSWSYKNETNGDVISIRSSKDSIVDITAITVGKSVVTCELEDGTKLTCEVIVKADKPVVKPPFVKEPTVSIPEVEEAPTANPQTGDTWLSNLFSF